MSGIRELICSEEDGTLSFGNYTLTEKAKKSDFEHDGDLYKVKTCEEITKLERNGGFVYESVPGTAVHHFSETGTSVSFTVDASEDAQITLEMEDDTVYRISLDGEDIGTMKTGIGGKLTIGVETGAKDSVSVRIERM